MENRTRKKGEPIRLTLEIPAEHVAAIMRTALPEEMKQHCRKSTIRWHVKVGFKRPTICEECGDKDSPIQLHHVSYFGQGDQFEWLCGDCHRGRTTSDIAVARAMLNAISIAVHKAVGIELINHGIGDDFRVRANGGES